MDIITRKEAKAKGYTYYFTGKPCKRGHIAPRNTGSANCHQCWCEHAKQKREEDPEAFHKKKQQEYEQNKEQILAQHKRYRQENWQEILRRRRISPTYKHYMRKYFRQYFKQPEARAKHLSRIRKRQTMLLNAIPEWFDREQVEALYIECSRITQETGTEHHVDHIIPLQGETVCGLHCHTNLQVLPATENRAKSNLLEDD